jgi:hypothetical protein
MHGSIVEELQLQPTLKGDTSVISVRKTLNVIFCMVLWSCGGSSSSVDGGGVAQDGGGQSEVMGVGNAGVLTDGSVGGSGGATAAIDGSVPGPIGGLAGGQGGGPVIVNETGKARLQGNDGITGVADGVEFTYQLNPTVDDQAVLQIKAR